MPLDASKNSLVLPLLGLLVEQPAHAYDLTTRLCGRYAHLTATRSSVTTLLKAMEKTGTITPRAAERVGNRPPRTTYELTPAGLADFRHRVEAGLRAAPVASIDFVLAISYTAILTADRAATLLEARATGLTEVPTTGAPEIHMLEAGYWNAIIAAERAWITGIAGRIRTHDLTWGPS
ncbi:PadR family transcriptional regulator [Actinoplanes sp. NPDC051494]|uniref:PadR family transcriptional regulator n=1 Tax=Actinoplanes sp. NPDC051494 TaxID=3363907 RepID=UPI0037AE5CF4